MKKIAFATLLVLSALTASFASTEARLHSVAVFSGTASGSFENLRVQDNRTFTVTTGPRLIDWAVTAGAHITAAATTRLKIEIRAQKTVSGPVMLHLLDWRTMTWVPMMSMNFGVNRMTTSTLTIFQNASRWVVPGGSIRARFVSTAGGSMFTDLVRITVN